MRNEANPDRNSTVSKVEGDWARGREQSDRALQAIRAVLEADDAEQTVENARPVRTEEDIEPQGLRVHASDEPHQKKSPAEWLLELVRSFLGRPDAPKLLSVLLLLTLFMLRPGFILFLFFMALLIGIVLYFSLGPDTVQNWVIERHLRLRNRDPAAAERLRRCAAATSQRLAVVAEKLPESWTQGLYIPDFEEPSEHPARLHSDPFERLANGKNLGPDAF
jgi:hypothetical protein